MTLSLSTAQDVQGNSSQQHHIRHVEDAGSQTSYSDIQEIRHSPIVGKSVYPVTHSAGGDQRQGNNLPAPEATGEDRCHECRQANQPDSDDENDRPDVIRESVSKAQKRARVFCMNQPKGITQKRLGLTQNQVSAHNFFGDLVATDAAQEQD